MRRSRRQTSSGAAPKRRAQNSDTPNRSRSRRRPEEQPPVTPRTRRTKATPLIVKPHTCVGTPTEDAWDLLQQEKQIVKNKPKKAPETEHTENVLWVDDENDEPLSDGIQEPSSIHRASVISVSELPPAPGSQEYPKSPLGGFAVSGATVKLDEDERLTASFGGSPHKRQFNSLIEESEEEMSPQRIATTLPTCTYLASDHSSFPFWNDATVPAFLKGPIQRDLPLVPHLDRLLHLFQCAERVIQQRRLKGLPLFLHTALPGVPTLLEATSFAARLSVTLPVLRQQAWLAPHLWKLAWGKATDREKKKVWDLELQQLPTDPNGQIVMGLLTKAQLLKRSQLFKEAAARWIYVRQAEWLLSCDPPDEVVPLGMLAKWHANFPAANQVPAVPLIGLPARNEELKPPRTPTKSPRTPTAYAIPNRSPREFHTPLSGSSGIWAREIAEPDGPPRTPFSALGKMVQNLSLKSASPSSAAGNSAKRTLTPGQQRLLDRAQERRRRKNAEDALQSSLNDLRQEVEVAEDAAAALGAAASLFLCSGRLPFVPIKTAVSRLHTALQAKVPGITTGRVEAALRVTAEHSAALEFIRRDSGKEMVKLSKDPAVVTQGKALLLSLADEIGIRNKQLRQERIAEWLAANGQ